ncbi:MAG: hypothetical protein MUO50_16625 [Longimicrobiales bacterium]|nr:hypothetical protein [Longimicrobiales bacterium]
MPQGRFWTATLAGGVTLFIVGFLLWGMALSGFFEAHVGSATGVVKEPMDMLHLALGQIIWAALLTVVMAKWAGVSGFGPGMKIGAIMGFLMSLSIGLNQFSMTNLFDLTTVLTDPFVSAVWSGLGGGVIGLVLGSGNEETAA